MQVQGFVIRQNALCMICGSVINNDMTERNSYEVGGWKEKQRNDKGNMKGKEGNGKE